MKDLKNKDKMTFSDFLILLVLSGVIWGLGVDLNTYTFIIPGIAGTFVGFLGLLFKNL